MSPHVTKSIVWTFDPTCPNHRTYVNMNSKVFIELTASISFNSQGKWFIILEDSHLGERMMILLECMGRFFGIIGQDPSVFSSSQVTCCYLLHFLYWFEVYSRGSSIMISNFSEVLNFNWFICNYIKNDIYCHLLFVFTQCYIFLLLMGFIIK